MKQIPHQKRVTVNKERVEKDTGRERPFFIAYRDTIEKAASELKGNAFKVYIYIMTNQDNFYFGLSPQDISNRYGMSADSARDAINLLIDKGYLVLLEGTNNDYTFYDRTDRKPIILPDVITEQLETKTFLNRKTGEKVEYTYKQILEMVGSEETARNIWEGNN